MSKKTGQEVFLERSREGGREREEDTWTIRDSAASFIWPLGVGAVVTHSMPGLIVEVGVCTLMNIIPFDIKEGNKEK